MNSKHTLRIMENFSAGHRLLLSTGKCRQPHGHNYRVELFVSSKTLPAMGMVYDFSDLKKSVKTWIDTNWDHAFIINSNDQSLINAFNQISDAKIYLVKAADPTAEVLSQILFNEISSIIELKVDAVRVWESDKQYAEYTG